MESQERPQPTALGYETLPPGGIRVPKFNGWWIVLSLLPVFLYWYVGSTLNTSNVMTGSVYTASAFATLAIGARALVGVLRKERNLTWLIYLPLYALLPEIARVGAYYASALGWARG